VTLKMLTNQTTGYPDFETDPKFLAAFNADPFHIFTFEERLKIAFSRRIQFEPGTNWSYAHTNFMILGQILSKIGGKPLDMLLLGFGKKQDNCAPSCGPQTNVYNYGLGIVRSGSWILQNPLLGGLGAIEAYLPSKKIAIAVAVTFAPEAFDSQGNYANSSDTLFRSIGAYMAPDDAPPLPPSVKTSPMPESPKALPSVADTSVQSAIVAAVEDDRKRFG